LVKIGDAVDLIEAIIARRQTNIGRGGHRDRAYRRGPGAVLVKLIDAALLLSPAGD
jgi:hypothetical protein